MTTNTTRETQIIADPALPTVAIIREFDAPRDRVFRAWTDAALVAQWMGPNSVEMRIDSWDCRTGGSYRYAAVRDGEAFVNFYGSFHEVRPDARLVQTFTFDGEPDGVSLDTAVFEDIDGRTRVTITSVVDTMEARDAMLSSGMDVGVNEGFQKLDTLLAGQA